MKAILEFSLPEDREDFNMARQASALSVALEDIQTYLRALHKYSDLSKEKQELLEEIRTKFFEIISELDI